MNYNLRTLTFLSLICLSLNGVYSQTLETDTSLTRGQNMLALISDRDLADLQWLNKPSDYGLANGELIITAKQGSDFFINPEDMAVSNSAPVLYKELADDFIATVSVSPDLSSMWNAAGLLLMIDDSHWIKFVFENSDATGPSIVSVTTRGISDDANGVRLAEKSTIWLKIIRKGNNYAMHWSADGTNFKMARLSAMPASAKVKIGLEAQSPVGEKAIHKFHHFSIESKTVKNLRKGE